MSGGTHENPGMKQITTSSTVIVDKEIQLAILSQFQD